MKIEPDAIWALLPGSRARMFLAGTLVGAALGAFLVSMVVWHYGNVIGSRAARDAYPPDRPAAIERWTGGVDSGGEAVLQPAGPRPAATTGTRAPDPADAPGGGARISRAPGTTDEDLEARDLQMPVAGVTPDMLTRQFDDLRGASRRHEAIDILAPRNTPVVAADDGTIARLFHSEAGGLTIYQFDRSGRVCYYYAHLERYADGLLEGRPVSRGDVIGYVGTSGNAPESTPHLHFAVFLLTSEKRWWEGTPVDPYDLLK